MQFNRGIASRIAVALVTGLALFGSVAAAYAQQIIVRGTQRVDAETIRSYFRGTDQARINSAVKELYETGLFSDVRVTRSRGRIVITVTENRLINRVAFEGNSKVKSNILRREIQSRSRGAYNPATVQADEQRLRDVYRRAGRGDASVSSRLVNLPNGRVDVVFTIKEGSKTGVREIRFIGNKAISSYRLRRLMQTTEMNFLSFLKNTDIYDPDKIAADLERIRRYYLKNGYADFRVIGSDARYSESRKGWILTFTFDEGPKYKVGSVRVESRLPDVQPGELRRAVRVSRGQTYNGDKVEKSVEALTRRLAQRGYAFASATPRGQRNPGNRTVDLSFILEEGPRVYVERIVIRGNTRTRDYVIRREFDLGEGDAYNRVLVEKARKRLNNLGFFKSVKITNQPGSAPDRVIIVVDVQDKPTGSFGIAGGYSTQDGLIGEVSLSESNFMGRGQYVRIAATLGQKTRGVDLSFTEPRFMGYRMSAGFDLFHKQTSRNQYQLYEHWITGGTIRFGVPITDNFGVGLRYSLYNTRIKIPNTASRPYNDCTQPIIGVTPGTAGSPFPVPGPGTNGVTCITNGEASLAVKEAAGSQLTSLAGFTLTYNTLDNNKNPTSGLLAQVNFDIAGLGGTSRFLRTTGDLRYYYPLIEDITLLVRAQGGHIRAYGGKRLRIIDNFNPGPSLVRGFAPGGIGPRDVSFGLDRNSNALGGTTYYGGTIELQAPIWGMPRELGLRWAVFFDAGTVFGYKGVTNFAGVVPVAAGAQVACGVGGTQPLLNAGGAAYTQCLNIAVRDSHKIRSSVGVSILWKSPLGPIRFDYARALTKDRNDVTQSFRFSGGTSF